MVVLVSTMASATSSWAVFTMAMEAGLVLVLYVGGWIVWVPRLTIAAPWLQWSTWDSTPTVPGVCCVVAGLCLAFQVGVDLSTWDLTSMVAGLCLALQVRWRGVGPCNLASVCFAVLGLHEAGQVAWPPSAGPPCALTSSAAAGLVLALQVRCR